MRSHNNFLFVVTIICLILLSCTGCRGINDPRYHKECIVVTPSSFVSMGEEVTLDWSKLGSSPVIDHWVIKWESNKSFTTWVTLDDTYPAITQEVTFLLPYLGTYKNPKVRFRITGMDWNDRIVVWSTTDFIPTTYLLTTNID